MPRETLRDKIENTAAAILIGGTLLAGFVYSVVEGFLPDYEARRGDCMISVNTISVEVAKEYWDSYRVLSEECGDVKRNYMLDGEH